jgi:hypothetical protein
VASKRRGPCGSRWRILAQAVRGRKQVEACGDGTTVFDELVVDDWFHLEQMRAREWWLAIGDARLWITIRRDGSARVFVGEGHIDARGNLVGPPMPRGVKP